MKRSQAGVQERQSALGRCRLRCASWSCAFSIGAQRPARSLGAGGAEPACSLRSPFFVRRSQELHLRTEAHSYLSDLTKPSDLEFIETKRPRLELLQDPLLRHSPLLSQGQQAGGEELPKVSAATRVPLCRAACHTVCGAVGWHALRWGDF